MDVGSDNEGVDLFPMLNVFLCVFGVLAFLTVLATGVRATLEANAAPPAPESASVLQVLCFAEGVLLIPPPSERLKALAAGSVNDVEKRQLEEVMSRRGEIVRELQALGDDLVSGTSTGESVPVEQFLAEVEQVNRAAANAYSAYREALLFRVFPGGGATYDEMLGRVLASDHRYVERGVALVDAGWSPRE